MRTGVHKTQLFNGDAPNTGFCAKLCDIRGKLCVFFLQGGGLRLQNLALLLVTQHGGAQRDQRDGGHQNGDQYQNLHKKGTAAVDQSNPMEGTLLCHGYSSGFPPSGTDDYYTLL